MKKELLEIVKQSELKLSLLTGLSSKGAPAFFLTFTIIFYLLFSLFF